MGERICDVRFPLESSHSPRRFSCPLSANSGYYQLTRMPALPPMPSISSPKVLAERGSSIQRQRLEKESVGMSPTLWSVGQQRRIGKDKVDAGLCGLSLLLEALAWFECRFVDEFPVGDHALILGRVIGGKLLDSEAEPLSYRETGAMDGAAALFPDGLGD
jgi:hypothetical protein